MQRAKRKYVPDLVKQSAICEANYARLRRLLPAGEKNREYKVDWHRCDYRVSIRMDEEFAYTSTLVVSYWPESASPWFNPQTFVVRLITMLEWPKWSVCKSVSSSTVATTIRTL